MSGAVTTAAIGAVAGAVISNVLAPDVSIPSPAEPTKPPQASKAPDTSTIRAGQAGTGQSGGAPGAAGTFLTGVGGVDPNSLNLGKSTLLGS